MKDTESEPSAVQLCVEAMECELSVDTSQFHIDFALDKAVKCTSTFNAQVTVPFSRSNSHLQLTVRSAAPQPESRPMGSISLSLLELLSLNRETEAKHWITLFDDEDDNVYDGDYQEDDIDMPRVLVTYRVVRGIAPAAEMEPAGVEEEEPQPGRGISFGPQQFRTDETLGSKKDSEVLLKSPEKAAEVQAEQEANPEPEEVKTPEEEPLPAASGADVPKEGGPRPEQNLFTLSENSKEAEPSGKAENPLIFSRQAIIEATLSPSKPGIKETQSEPLEPEPENKCSTVEYIETLSEKGPSSARGPSEVPLSLAFAGEKRQEQDEEEESPRFGASVEGQAAVEPEIKESPEAEQKAEKDYTEQDATKISNQLITGMNDRIRKLKQELVDVEQEKSGMFARHQKEIQTFDGQMSSWLKEKQELKSKIASLEYELGMSKQTVNQRAVELAQLKDFYENERTLRDQEHSIKVTQFEARVQSLQQQTLELKAKASSVSKMSVAESASTVVGTQGKELAEKVAAAGKEYEEKVRSMHELLLESEAKNSEYARLLQESETHAEETESTLASLKDENETLKKELSRLKDELAKQKAKCMEQSNALSNLERENNRRVSELIEENVKLRTRAEESKALLEGGNAKISVESQKMVTRIEELEGEKTEAAALGREMKEDIRIMTEKLEKAAHDFGEERAATGKRLAEKDQEVRQLREKCKNLELDLGKRNSLAEDCARQEKTIRSLQQLLEEARQEREKLLARLRDLQLECENLRHDTERGVQDEDITESLSGSKASAAAGSYQKRSERLGDVAQRSVETEKKRLGREREKEDERRQKDALQIQELGRNYTKLLKQLEDLNASLKPKKEENEQLKQIVSKYKREVDSLKAELADKSNLLSSVVGREAAEALTSGRSPDKAGAASSASAAAASIDRVDRMLVQHMSKAKCPVVVRKLGRGQYIFGTRKIFAKIHNGKLVIRVGGGYMLIDEFLSIYTTHELGKLEKAANANMSAVELDSSDAVDPGAVGNRML